MASSCPIMFGGHSCGCAQGRDNALVPELIEKGCTDLLIVHAIDVTHTATDEETITYFQGCVRAVAEAPYKCVPRPPLLVRNSITTVWSCYPGFTDLCRRGANVVDVQEERVRAFCPAQDQDLKQGRCKVDWPRRYGIFHSHVLTLSCVHNSTALSTPTRTSTVMVARSTI